MSKLKKWLITVALLILIGSIVFGGMMTLLKWDFTKLGTGKYETNTYDINDNFSNISISTDTADILFSPSDNRNFKVVCYEKASIKHSVKIQDNTLKITVVDNRKWYEYIGINFGTPKITIFIPQGEYGKLLLNVKTGNVELPEAFKFTSVDITQSTGDVKCLSSVTGALKIQTTTGDIKAEKLTADSLNLSASTGKITVENVTCKGEVKTKVSTGKTELTNVKCKSLVSNGTTGSVNLNTVIATESLSVERSTGNVKLAGCDAAEIFIKTSTGDINGVLLTEKVFITSTDTGHIDVPKSITGGRCEITTTTGNIKMEVTT